MRENGNVFQVERVEEGAVLIDRHSAMLVSFASSLMDEGKKANVQGGNKIKMLLTKMMEGTFLLIGFTGGVPWIYSASHAAQDKLLADFFVAGVLITGGSNGGWVFWSLNKKLFQLTEPYREATKKIYEDQIVSQRVKHPVVNFLSVVSTLPYVYKTYLYNDIKWLALLDFFISYGYKALGYYNFWEALSLFSSCKDSEQIKTLRIILQKMRRILQKDITRFLINLSPDRALEQLSAFSAVLDNTQDRSRGFIHAVLTLDMEPKRLLPTTWLKGYPRKFFVATSTIIPICFSIVNGTFSYYGALRVVNNRVFASFATTCAAIPTFVVDLSVTAQTFETFFDYIFNKWQGSKTSLYEVFYPNALVKFGIPFLALGISVLATSNNVYSTRSFLSSLPEFEGGYKVEMLTWFYAIANVIFSTYTLVKLAGVGLKRYAASFGKDPLRQLYAKVFDAVERLDSFLERLTPQMFGRFIHGLGDQTVEDKLFQMGTSSSGNAATNPSSFFAHSGRVTTEQPSNVDKDSSHHQSFTERMRCHIM